MRAAVRMLATVTVAVISLALLAPAAHAQYKAPGGYGQAVVIVSAKQAVTLFKQGKLGHRKGHPKQCDISAGEAKSGVIDCRGDYMSNAEIDVWECTGMAGLGMLRGGGWYGAFIGASGCAMGKMLEGMKHR